MLGFVIRTGILLHLEGSASSTNYRCLFFFTKIGTEHSQLVDCNFKRRQRYDIAKIHTHMQSTNIPTLSSFAKVVLMSK